MLSFTQAKADFTKFVGKQRKEAEQYAAGLLVQITEKYQHAAQTSAERPLPPFALKPLLTPPVDDSAVLTGDLRRRVRNLAREHPYTTREAIAGLLGHSLKQVTDALAHHPPVALRYDDVPAAPAPAPPAPPKRWRTLTVKKVALIIELNASKRYWSTQDIAAKVKCTPEQVLAIIGNGCRQGKVK